MQHSDRYIVPCRFFIDFNSDAMSIGARNCKLIIYSTNSVSLCTWHIYHACFLPYMFYNTCFTCSTIHILPYTFSEIAYRKWNYKGVKLPSDCVVPGSWSFHTFGCCFVNWRGVLMRWTISDFLFILGWAPCQVGTRLVELASLSSKSICNLCVAFGVQGAVLASAFLCPVCSISWLGSSREEGPIPIGELDEIDLMFVCESRWYFLVEIKAGEV